MKKPSRTQAVLTTQHDMDKAPAAWFSLWSRHKQELHYTVHLLLCTSQHQKHCHYEWDVEHTSGKLPALCFRHQQMVNSAVAASGRGPVGCYRGTISQSSFCRNRKNAGSNNNRDSLSVGKRTLVFFIQLVVVTIQQQLDVPMTMNGENENDNDNGVVWHLKIILPPSMKKSCSTKFLILVQNGSSEMDSIPLAWWWKKYLVQKSVVKLQIYFTCCRGAHN